MGFWSFLWNRKHQPVAAKYNSWYDEAHRTVEVFALLRVKANIQQVWALLIALALEHMQGQVDATTLKAGQKLKSFDQKTIYEIKKYQDDPHLKIYQIDYRQGENYFTTTFKWRSKNTHQSQVKIQYTHRLIFEQTVGGLGGALSRFQFKTNFKNKARQLEDYLNQKLAY